MKHLIKLTFTVVSVIAFTFALAPRMSADEGNQQTTVTFSAPVEIPGQVLPGGHLRV